MRREWIEIKCPADRITDFFASPSMRREWIEMSMFIVAYANNSVSLHAEGVD